MGYTCTHARVHTSLTFLSRIVLRIVKERHAARVMHEMPQGCGGVEGDTAANGEGVAGRVGIAGGGHAASNEEEEGEEEEEEEEEDGDHDVYPLLEDQV